MTVQPSFGWSMRRKPIARKFCRGMGSWLAVVLPSVSRHNMLVWACLAVSKMWIFLWSVLQPWSENVQVSTIKVGPITGAQVVSVINFFIAGVRSIGISWNIYHCRMLIPPDSFPNSCFPVNNLEYSPVSIVCYLTVVQRWVSQFAINAHHLTTQKERKLQTSW